MITNKIIHRILCITALVGISLAACVPATPVMGGIVQGAVYADLNGNGSVDPGEGVVEGAEVTLADCGPSQTLVTAADGLFNFHDLPEGTCHVSVTKAGWIYSGSYPVLTYPVPVASNPDLPTSFSLFIAPVMDVLPDFSPTPPPSTPYVAGPLDTPTSVASPTSSNPMVTPKVDPANCRFGPGTEFSSVGGLAAGSLVAIHGTIPDHSWWQIESPQNPGSLCWVSAAVTNTLGDLSLVPIVPIPTGMVTAVTVTVNSGPVLHGFCGSPNAVSFQVSITTNGPVSVIYHVEIYNGDGTLRNSTSDSTLVFPNASTQTLDPGGAYHTDCGNFIVKALVTNPNTISGQATWMVVQP
jgi:hypothetical protein